MECVILHRIRYKTFNTSEISYIIVTKKNMVRTFLRSITAGLILGLLSSISTTNANTTAGNTINTSQKLNVVTSVSPITNIIKNVGGNVDDA